MKLETKIINLDSPIAALFCDQCGQTVRPLTQTRLTAEECGQEADYIAWNCPCGQSNFTADDVSILDTDILME